MTSGSQDQTSLFYSVEKEDRGEYGGGEHGTGEDEGCAGGHSGIELAMFMVIL